MRRAWFSALLVLLPSLGWGQRPAADEQPIFRAGIDLVRLDVRVTDAEGRPIKDLRADEIEVFEEGAPRPILLFQHIDEPAGSLVEVARRTVAGDVSTNQGAFRGHLYVLVFDQHHITPGHEQRARRAAEQFLRRRLRPGDRVAVFGVPGPGPQLDFTADVERAAAALEQVRGAADPLALGPLGAMRIYEAYRIKRGDEDVLARVFTRLNTEGGLSDVDGVPGLGPALSAALGAGDPAVVRQLIREDARTIVARADEESRRFLLMLTDVMRALRPIEGRKAVMVFSEGFIADNLSRELEQVSAAAALSYSVVYGFDLNQRGPSVTDEAPRGTEGQAEIQDRIEPLGSLAAETDGMLINHAQQQLDRALALIADQSQDYYIVGFAPHPEATKDHYRRVRVRVKRPGAQVGARSGYAMAPDPRSVDRRGAIDQALAAPFPQQGLPVEYTTYLLRGSDAGRHRVVLSLAAELPIGQDRRADVVFAVRSARDGAVVASGTDTMPLPGASRPGAGTGIGTFRVQFELPPGEYLMRAVVREPGGLVGSADRHLIVRPLDGPALAAGDLILNSDGGSRLPVRAVAYANYTLNGVLMLYARMHADLEDLAIELDLIPSGSDRAVTTVAADLLAIQTEAMGASRLAQFDVPLGGVRPGRYVARARIRSKGQATGELVREVEVSEGIPPAETTKPLAATTPAPQPPRAPDILSGDLARAYLQALGGAHLGTTLAEAAALGAAGSWDKAGAALGAVAQDAPAAAHVLMGLARFTGGDYAGAATALERGLELAPDARGAFLLGWVHAVAGDDRSAITAWRRATVLQPTLVPPYLALIDAYLRLGQPALVFQVIQAGLAAVPDSPELLDRRARLIGR